MATFTKLKSGSWRAQIRRKGQYLNETFLRRKDAEEWALDMERRIDRQEPAVTRKSRDAKLFGDLIALHRQDMEEVGIKIGRSKDFCLIALDEALGQLKLPELDRERLIKFGRERAKEGAGPVTLGMDFGYIKTVLSHAAAVHGVTISTEPLDLAGTRPGNALFVPPPVTEFDACLAALEAFMHEDQSRLPALIKVGLLHVQFETIHPFLDGNGRIGRLLVTLYLCVHGVLRRPLLYLSLYLKTHRADYYRLLQEVRERGAWEAWLEFFLKGVAETANQAFDAATRTVDLFRADRERITAESDRAGSALRIHELLQQHPFLTAGQLVAQTGLSMPTVNAALADLERLGIVEEVTGRKRGRVFGYRRYLAILSEGTDPLPVAV